MADAGHLAAWQWLFLIEGIPSMLAGVATLVFLPESPTKSGWLTDQQKQLIAQRLEEEEQVKLASGGGHHKLADAFRSWKVWVLCLVYFGMVIGNYGLFFWLPQVINDTITKDPLLIGWVSLIPWGTATVFMIWAGHHSDKTGERRWHVALCSLLGALAFAASAIPNMPGAAGILALTFAAMGIEAAIALFWALPTGLLSGAAAAAGIAWINSVGNLAGFVGQYVVGAVRDKTGSMVPALLTLAAGALVSSLLTLYVARHPKAGTQAHGAIK
jgi:nitrate/nitrite transporter NarK